MTFRRTGVVLTAVLVLALSAAAHAQLDDPPYFNLWEGSPGSGQTVAGDGASVRVCGTQVSGNKCDVEGQAIFSAMEPNSGAGSGHILPFLRFQHTEKAADGTYQLYPSNVDTGASGGVEGAYNTNAGEHTIDLEGRAEGALNPDNDFINQAKDAPGTKFNHAIKLSDLLVDDDGFVEFFLDINEPNGDTKEILRMDELKLFVANNDVLNDYDPYTAEGGAPGTFGANAVKVWDMAHDKDWTNPGNTESPDNDASACVTDLGESDGCGGFNLNNEVGTGGSGDLDYRLQVQSSLFSDALSTLGVSADDAYVYLYNYAGAADDTPIGDGNEIAQAGFEEWIFTANPDVTTPPPETGAPEPGAAMLMGMGLIGFVALRRRGRPVPGDSRIAGG